MIILDLIPFETSAYIRKSINVSLPIELMGMSLSIHASLLEENVNSKTHSPKSAFVFIN